MEPEDLHFHFQSSLQTSTTSPSHHCFKGSKYVQFQHLLFSGGAKKHRAFLQSLLRHKRELLTTSSFVGKRVSQGHGGNWWQNRVFWKDPAIQPDTESTLPHLQHPKASCRMLAIHCFNVEDRVLHVTLQNLSCKRNSTCFPGTSPFASPPPQMVARLETSCFLKAEIKNGSVFC